jgi:hypothetical protein
MNPSTEWAALVTATMNKHRITYSEALRVCKAERPDFVVLMSAYGRSRNTVQFFNSRYAQKITPDRLIARKQLSQFVNEKVAQGLSYPMAMDAATREHPEIYAATHSNQGPGYVKIGMPGEKNNAQFTNDGEMPSPVVASPKMKFMFWLDANAPQDVFEAAWKGNGSVPSPLNPAKIFAGLVDYAKQKNNLSTDEAIAQVKAAQPRLWEACEALSKYPV